MGLPIAVRDWELLQLGWRWTAMETTRLVAAAALVIVVAACSDATGDPLELGASTSVAAARTEVPAPGSATSESPSDVRVDTVTNAAGQATSTLPSTTLATSTPTTDTSTTTTLAPTPVWADKPLVITGGWMGALGWWDEGKWVRVQSDTVLPIRSGEDYQIVLLGREGLVAGGSQLERCDFTLTTPGVELENGGADRLFDYEGGLRGLAISAPWDLTPNPVEQISDDGTYAALAAEILKERGQEIDEPIIRQLIRLDLEGDGVDEVLVVAGDTAGSTEITFGEAQPGDYSVVFLRRLTDSGVATWVLAESVAIEGESVWWSAFAVSGVADLNGDAKMEIIVSGVAWESSWVGVFEYIDDTIGPEVVMNAGCGV